MKVRSNVRGGVLFEAADFVIVGFLISFFQE